MLEYYRKRKQALIEDLGGCCVQCGSKDQLEIDHRDRTTKEFDVSKLWGLSKEKQKHELAKCQVLCQKCHKAKSARECSELFSVPHGGGVSGKYNCPCSLCKQKKSEYMREYNKTHVRKRDRDKITP
jgi:hypothetical protein